MTGVSQILGVPLSDYGIYLFYIPCCFMVVPALLVLWHAFRRRRWPLASLSLLFWGWLLGPFMGFAWSVPPKIVGRRLRVVSVNAESWSADLKLSATVLAAEQPDVLLLQEMWSMNAHLPDLRRELPGFVFQGGDPTGADGVVVGSRFPIRACRPPAPLNCFASITKISGREILLMSVHGRKTAGFGSAALTRSVELQRDQDEEIQEYLAAHRMPLILGADLNSTPHAPLSKGLQSRSMDAFRSGGRGYGYTFPSIFPFMRIDYVMISPDLGSVVSSRTLDVGSDHLAVVADIVLPR